MDNDFARAILIFYRKAIKDHPRRLTTMRAANETVNDARSLSETLDRYSYHKLDYSEESPQLRNATEQRTAVKRPYHEEVNVGSRSIWE